MNAQVVASETPQSASLTFPQQVVRFLQAKDTERWRTIDEHSGVVQLISGSSEVRTAGNKAAHDAGPLAEDIMIAVNAVHDMGSGQN